MRDYIKFGGNLMEVSGILSGVAIYVSGRSTHMNVEEVGAPPWLPRHGRVLPPLPVKGTHFLLSSHTSSRRISLPPLEFPHGLGSAMSCHAIHRNPRITIFARHNRIGY